jgi:hypothetical protein
MRSGDMKLIAALIAAFAVVLTDASAARDPSPRCASPTTG